MAFPQKTTKVNSVDFKRDERAYMSEPNLTLEGAVNIAKAEKLHGELEELLKHGTPTIIDASGVSRADTAALQLLASFFQSMKAAEVDVTWHEVAEELVEAAKLAGLAVMLGLSS